MPQTDPEYLFRLSQSRLAELLDLLGQQGLSQQQIAARASLPPQVLSDLKHGRRALSELVARRLGDAFQLNHEWLLGLGSHLQAPAPRDAQHPVNALPMLPHPVEGEPRADPAWDGTLVEVAGAAAGKLLSARLPYVVRFQKEDVEGRLQPQDQVLINQTPSDQAEILVVKTQKKIFLARLRNGQWQRVAKVKGGSGKLPRDCQVVGHCLGVVWSALCRTSPP